MSPVEIIALIFAIVILLKMIMLSVVKPKFVIKKMNMMTENKALMPVLLVVVAAIIGYFLMQELTAAEILAASVFGILIYASVLVMYPKQLTKLMKAILKDKKNLWLAVVLWVAVAVYTLYTMFG